MCHSLVRRRVCGDMYICHVNTAGVPSSFLLMSIILVDSYLDRTHLLDVSPSRAARARDRHCAMLGDDHARDALGLDPSYIIGSRGLR